GAEIAVDVVLRDPGILDRALCNFGMKLGGGFVRRMPGRVFVDPGNIGLALDGQNVRSPRSRFFLLRFSEPRGPAWQARKYSVGREGSGLAQVGANLVCLQVGIASAAKQSRSLSADALLDCFAALAMTNATTKILKVFCPTAQGIFFFYENNPIHSRTLVDFKEEIVGWVSR